MPKFVWLFLRRLGSSKTNKSGLESDTQPTSKDITQALAQLRVPKPGVSFGESDTRMLRLNKRQMESYAQLMLERIFYQL